MATWYKTGEEIKAMYPDIIFEEYWITREDAAKLKRHEPVIKGWATIEMNGNILSCIAGKIRAMNEIYYYILKHYPHLMMM